MHACTYAPFYQQFSSAFFLDFKTFLMEIILFVFLIFPHFLHENKRLRFPKAEGSYKSKKASSYRPVRRFQVPFVLACTNISLNSFYKSVNVYWFTCIHSMMNTCSELLLIIILTFFKSSPADWLVFPLWFPDGFKKVGKYQLLNKYFYSQLFIPVLNTNLPWSKITKWLSVVL